MKMWPMAICLAVLSPFVGCGGRGYSTALVEGRVTINGEPVEQGNITFTPLQAGRGHGVTAAILAGWYVAKDVPQGRVRVDFYAIKETGRTVADFGKPYPETVNVIPGKYRAGLEIEVGADKNSRDFNL